MGNAVGEGEDCVRVASHFKVSLPVSVKVLRLGSKVRWEAEGDEEGGDEGDGEKVKELCQGVCRECGGW